MSCSKTQGGSDVDPSVQCGGCDAICCRLTVVLDPDDRVPSHLTDYTHDGLHVMARDEEGWCVAVDPEMGCSIYASRPDVCRRFVMGAPYCRDVRQVHHDQLRRGIPLTMY
ncbi:YkgJ family cysteine cluster protein [Pseudoxanthomonas sp. JBR18]|uniref:YkgJ family cysteine cluster protein n=1 Tax=Pseudoxanthomonas sp. JBR18 TaxID=2969308 RepID=UPI00230689B7|nr:YkgJ family cysteine cluster protein [Pseudoxanthomonas sp. JBR18]WCE03405.1 YkgJ family cysteine cluster protein [Pseudoxanthomonas sp. JBR18]